jgi:hypothetical protein
MLVGVHTNVERDKVFPKKLGILRKTIYSCNHDGRIPRWEEALSDIKAQYIMEYGIAERQGRVCKVLTDWNL